MDNRKHNVLATSIAFEIRAEKVKNDNTEDIKKTLLPLVRNSLDNIKKLCPETVEDGYIIPDIEGDKYCKRISTGIRLIFGVDFSPDVIKYDHSIPLLAQRVYNAVRALQPFSHVSIREDDDEIESKDL